MERRETTLTDRLKPFSGVPVLFEAVLLCNVTDEVGVVGIEQVERDLHTLFGSVGVDVRYVGVGGRKCVDEIACSFFEVVVGHSEFERIGIDNKRSGRTIRQYHITHNIRYAVRGPISDYFGRYLPLTNHNLRMVYGPLEEVEEHIVVWPPALFEGCGSIEEMAERAEQEAQRLRELDEEGYRLAPVHTLGPSVELWKDHEDPPEMEIGEKFTE